MLDKFLSFQAECFYQRICPLRECASVTSAKLTQVDYNAYASGDEIVYNTNVTVFRKNILSLLERTIKFNEPIKISTQLGNVVVLSEEDYNSLLETLHISAIPELKAAIVEGLQMPLEECAHESEVEI